MAPEPALTVILPFRDAVRTLPAAVSSVIDQSFDFRRIELLLVDDGSTDGSTGIAEALARKHPNVRLLKASGSSGAAGEARNVGLDSATAPRIMFLDGDDMYEDCACTFLMGKAEELGSDIVGGSYLVMEGGHTLVPPLFNRILSRPILNMTASDFPALLLLPPIMQAKVFSSRFIKEKGIRFPEGMRTDDSVFSVTAVLKASTLSMFSVPVYRYVPRSAADRPSLTQSLEARSFRDFCQGRALIESAFREHGGLDYHTLRYPQDVAYILGRYISLPESSRVDGQAILEELRRFFSRAGRLNMDRFSTVEGVLIRLIARGRFTESEELTRLMRRAQEAGAELPGTGGR
jgi:hypothetical protein